QILARYIPDKNILWLLERVIGSFSSTRPGVGLPLGNLTSQLLVNIYMNEFDQFVKHTLKAKHYLRYADDFVVLSKNRAWLQGLIPQVNAFLLHHLCLTLHPNKVYITTLASGIDFLGWVHFPDHRVLRTATKRRMTRKLARSDVSREVVSSYRGLLHHGNTHKLQLKNFLF
ncbi:MAG: RNA-directed DNA polymerase, partial [Patescibacteria group bacterium]